MGLRGQSVTDTGTHEGLCWAACGSWRAFSSVLRRGGLRVQNPLRVGSRGSLGCVFGSLSRVYGLSSGGDRGLTPPSSSSRTLGLVLASTALGTRYSVKAEK